MDKLGGRLRQKGQALAEYMPLIAGFFAVSIFVVFVFGENLAQVYSNMLDALFGVTEPGPGADGGGQEPDPPCVDWSPAPGGSYCSQSDDCEEWEYDDGQYGTLIGEGDEPIEEVVIKAGGDYFVFSGPGDHDDGCYQVSVVGSVATWQRNGSDDSCKDVSHAQSWYRPFCEP